MIPASTNACRTAWMFGLPKRIKEHGADAVKFLLYYDVDSSTNNQQKQAYIERIGSECVAKVFHSSLAPRLR